MRACLLCMSSSDEICDEPVDDASLLVVMLSLDELRVRCVLVAAGAGDTIVDDFDLPTAMRVMRVDGDCCCLAADSAAAV